MNYIYEIKGIKIGLAGITALKVDSEASAKENTKKAIDYFKQQSVDLIIQRQYFKKKVNSIQGQLPILVYQY